MSQRELDALGDPDLKVANLRVWVHGRQFADALDYWDGNWLRVTARCETAGSKIRVHGSLVHLSELTRLLQGCEALYEKLEGRAALDCIEPELDLELTAITGGHIRVRVSITPDQLKETHTFTDEIDQTFLPPIIADCRKILEKYPVREAEKLSTPASSASVNPSKTP